MAEEEKQFSLPNTETEILAKWKREHTFSESLRQTRRGKPFIFYEGPPTANGRPGIHHVLARAFKDVIPRYKTMRGYFVERKGGWDTHGLPVELEVEKKLKLSSKRDIESFGIAAFNEACRESVWQYREEWERLTERIGYWLDLAHPYVTYETPYIESVWWFFKEAWKKKFVYRGHKVVPWCTRCGTGLSSHELALGYRTVEDTSVYVKFKVKPGQKIGSTTSNDRTYILSWTTTPWTLPGNVALAVAETIEYIVTGHGRDVFIIASTLAEKVLGKEGMMHREFTVKGNELVGLEYEPLFSVAPLVSERSYRVYAADFVTTTDGTGVVHTAVMYGEDDYRLGTTVGLPMVHTVDETGRFTDAVVAVTGLKIKAPETEQKILQLLTERNALLKTESYSHEYPYCWRCSTPLIYYARDSWFIAMSRLRAKLERANKTIQWIPATIRDGRFGEWLREVKDWAISRERYWGTPMPVWQCEACGVYDAIGSIAELRARAVPPATISFLRHGEAEHNLLKICGTHEDRPGHTYHLTEQGKSAVAKTAAQFSKKSFDSIVTSPLIRTQETAAIVSQVTGVPVVIENDLRDVDAGAFYARPVAEHHAFYATEEERFTRASEGGETLLELQKRMTGVIGKIISTNKGKNVLVVSHGDPLLLLKAAFEGVSPENVPKLPYPEKGALYPIDVSLASLTTRGALDLHRPFIDECTIRCASCAHIMHRVPEVLDVWFDSGAMPFAQHHHPFNANIKKLPYPADYIAEGIDQTRGWFYTLLAIATVLGKRAPYRNVISLGLLLDKNGQKMSKSKGNVVDPWMVIERYGADVLRWYCYTVNAPGEPKRFNEADLGTLYRRFFLILYNVASFYRTYADHRVPYHSVPKSKHILDEWILVRLNETVRATTDALDRYEAGDAARAIESFTDDLSRWYVRRSRGRFSGGAREAHAHKATPEYAIASHVLGYVLSTVSVLIAPFAPFFGEALYHMLPRPQKTSVHLESWPKIRRVSGARRLTTTMDAVRVIASAGLAERAAKGIKVRQPLTALSVGNRSVATDEAFAALVADEVNVKKVLYDASLSDRVMLDTVITHELREEGWFRELVRAVQGMRQDARLSPQDTIALFIESASDEIRHIIKTRNEALLRAVHASSISEVRMAGKCAVELDTKIDTFPLWIGIQK